MNSSPPRANLSQEEQEEDPVEMFRTILYFLFEMNVFLMALISLDVPVRMLEGPDSQILRRTYLLLRENIQLFMEEHKFDALDQMFRLPTHLIEHMLDDWIDIGNYNDVSCFVMERGCKRTKGLINPNGTPYKSLNRRLSTVVFTDLLDVARDSVSKDHSCDSWGRRAVSRKSDYQSEFRLFTERFGIPETAANVRTQIKVKVRNTNIDLTRGVSFAKMREGRQWKYLKITKLAVFEAKDDPSVCELYIEFIPVQMKKQWKQCQGGEMDFCVVTRFIVDETVEKDYIWLNDDIELFAIIVDPENDYILLHDKKPSFHELFRLHTG